MKVLFNLILLVLTGSLIACSTPDEETRLRDALQGVVKAVEDRSVRKVQKYFTDDFKTIRHSNIQQVKAFMLIHFRQNAVINVFTSDVQTQLSQGKADITFNVLVTGSSNWLPERGRRFAVESRWVKTGKDWKISRVNWQAINDF